ncbi:MAG: BON domain-containing protein [Planctomycetota bacterium]|nr:MAG: BON domain-containing protein [Planctomycetota bacterium]REK30620.1 MAG: BON domain-containing protein [Planctomycetota bacterium]REK32994.1 MAG: BON domain-containing protein [Planctomycetota bacterium]
MSVSQDRSMVPGSSPFAGSTSVALDDPVPADSGIAMVEPQYCRNPPHHIEQQVRRALLAEEDLHFSRLVVRRVADGVCLEGTLYLDPGRDSVDVDRLARQVAGVDLVINHLLVHSCH